MPIVTCFTNIKDSDLPDDFQQWLSSTVGHILDKPEERIVITVNPGCRMMRLGDPTSPMVFVQIHSINVFSKERNPGYTDKFCAAFCDKLGLSANRVSLQYFHLDNADFVGHGK